MPYYEGLTDRQGGNHLFNAAQAFDCLQELFASWPALRPAR